MIGFDSFLLRRYVLFSNPPKLFRYIDSENIENDENAQKKTLTQPSGSLSFSYFLHQISYISPLMQLVVPNAVRNAVSAATTIFTTISNALCFFSIVVFLFHFLIFSFFHSQKVAPEGANLMSQCRSRQSRRCRHHLSCRQCWSRRSQSRHSRRPRSQGLPPCRRRCWSRASPLRRCGCSR